MADYNLGTAHGTVKIDSDTTGVDKAGQSLDNIATKGQKTGEAVKSIGNYMGTAGLAIAGGLGVAVATATSFEASLSNIAAVGGKEAANRMTEIHDKALDIGKATTFSASEAATAMSELVKAGIPVADVLNGAADATVSLAAATGIDMPTAAGIASNAMNVFGIKAKDMDGVVDILAKTANASAIDIGDLGMSMQQVGAVANLAGLDLKDTAIAIGEMGDAGIKGSDAGTSLKTMLMNLQPATEKQAGLMKDLGIITKDGSNKFYDQEGHLKSLRDVQEILSSSLSGMTDAQKQAALETLFGSDAIRAGAVLVKNGAAGYDAFTQKLKDQASAQEQAKIRQDNMKGSLEQLKGSLENAGIAVGEILIPPLRELLGHIQGAVDWFTSLSAGTQKMIAYIALGAAGFLLMGSAIIKTVTFFSKLSESIGTIISALFRKNAAETASAANSERGAIRTIAAWVRMAVAATYNAVKIAIVWTAQTLAAGAVIAAQWTAVAVKTIAQWVLMGVQAAAQAAIVAGAWLISTGTAIATSLASMAVAVAATVGGWIAMAAQAVVSAVIIAAQWLIAFWPVALIIAIVVAVAAAIYIFWDDIVAAFKAGAKWVSDTMKAVWEWIKQAWAGIVAAFQAAGQAVLNALNQAWQWVQNVWNNILNFFRRIPGWIAGIFSGALSWLANAGHAILSGLQNGITGAWNALWGWIRGIPGWIGSIFSGAGSWLLSAGGDLIRGLWNGVTGMFNWVMGKIRGFASSVINGIKNFFGISSPSKETEWMGEMLSRGLGGGIIDNAHHAVDAAVSTAQRVMSAMQNTLDDGASLSAAIDGSLTPGAMDGLRGAAPMLGGNAGATGVGLNPVTGTGTSNSGRSAIEGQFGGKQIHIEMNTFNPIAEKASDNEARKLRAAAAVGAF